MKKNEVIKMIKKHREFHRDLYQEWFDMVNVDWKKRSIREMSDHIRSTELHYFVMKSIDRLLEQIAEEDK